MSPSPRREPSACLCARGRVGLRSRRNRAWWGWRLGCGSRSAPDGGRHSSAEARIGRVEVRFRADDAGAELGHGVVEVVAAPSSTDSFVSR